jgi:hypothetical protein
MLKLDCDSTGPGKVNPTRRARRFGPERATVGTVSTTGTHTADERTAYRRAGCVADKSQVTSHRSQVTRRNHRPCPSWIETRLTRRRRYTRRRTSASSHHRTLRRISPSRVGWVFHSKRVWRVASGESPTDLVLGAERPVQSPAVRGTAQYGVGWVEVGLCEVGAEYQPLICW